MKSLSFLFFLLALSSSHAFYSSNARNISGRVYGGVQANLGDYPFFAHCTFINANNIAILGAASFIRYNFLLTSAHVLHQRVEVIVLAGHVLWRDFYEYQEVVPGEDLILHENWNPNSLHINNIGLIRLRHSTPSIFNGNYIRPIALPTPSDGQNSFEGYSLRAMGFANWGALFSGDTRVILNSQCSQTFPSIGAGNVCISPDYGVAPCSGDDGGPGMVTRSGERILLGVFSGGNLETCSANRAVYTRVTSYLHWIESHMH